MKHLVTAAAIALAAPVSAQTVSIATLPQGSVWNTMGTVIGGTVREDGVQMVVQPYGGNLAFMEALDAGLAEFTINDVNDVIAARQGIDHYEGVSFENIRLVAKLSPQPIGLYVRADSGKDDMGDLKGMRVSSGWDAFPLANSHIAGLLSMGELTWDDVVGVPVPGLIRGSDDLAAGRTDAAFFAVGGPKVAEVAATVGGVRFLAGASDAGALERIRAVRPAFYFSEVTPAPHRAGIEEAMMMLTWDNVLLAGAHVPDEVVERVLASMADRRDAMAAAFPGLGAFDIERAFVDYPEVEWHPGAVAFFAKRGIEKQDF